MPELYEVYKIAFETHLRIKNLLFEKWEKYLNSFSHFP